MTFEHGVPRPHRQAFAGDRGVRDSTTKPWSTSPTRPTRRPAISRSKWRTRSMATSRSGSTTSAARKAAAKRLDHGARFPNDYRRHRLIAPATMVRAAVGRQPHRHRPAHALRAPAELALVRKAVVAACAAGRRGSPTASSAATRTALTKFSAKTLALPDGKEQGHTLSSADAQVAALAHAAPRRTNSGSRAPTASHPLSGLQTGAHEDQPDGTPAPGASPKPAAFPLPDPAQQGRQRHRGKKKGGGIRSLITAIRATPRSTLRRGARARAALQLSSRSPPPPPPCRSLKAPPPPILTANAHDFCKSAQHTIAYYKAVVGKMGQDWSIASCGSTSTRACRTRAAG